MSIEGRYEDFWDPHNVGYEKKMTRENRAEKEERKDKGQMGKQGVTKIKKEPEISKRMWSKA